MSIPLPVIPNVYYGYVYGTYQGRKTGNIFAFRDALSAGSSGAAVASAAAVADALQTAWHTNMQPRYPGAYTGVTARVYALGFPTVPPSFATASGTGSAGGDVAAFPTAAVVKHSVFRRGKGSQSHSLISPVMDDEISSDGTSLTDIAKSGLTSDFNAFITEVLSVYASEISGGALTYGQVSKKGAGAFYQITSSAAESLLGSARARTARHR